MKSEKLNLARIEALARAWGKVGDEFSVPALAAKLREARAIMRELVQELMLYDDSPVLVALANEFLNSISWKDEGDASEETK